MSEHDPVTLPSATAASSVVFDPRASRLTVRAFAGGVLSAFAHNPTFTARRFTVNLTLDPSAAAAAALKVVVDAASLQLVDQLSESDRREIERIMRQEVLEVERFPTIEFHSDRIEAQEAGGGRRHGSASGPLSLHGVTREIRVEADAVTMGTSLRVFGESSLRQTDFGIRLVSVAAQAIKVKDELKVAFDLVGRHQE